MDKSIVLEIKDKLEKLETAIFDYRNTVYAAILQRLSGYTEAKPLECDIKVDLVDFTGNRVYDSTKIVGMWINDSTIYLVENGGDWLSPNTLDYYLNQELIQIVEQL